MFAEIVLPLTRRVGTAMTAYLVGFGVAESSAEMIALGAVAGVTVLFELVASKLAREKVYLNGANAVVREFLASQKGE